MQVALSLPALKDGVSRAIWMNSLIKYDTARFALQQAVEIDEVKDIRDKAQAMAAYARQANDTKLVEWATEIKVRAERKAGQMLTEMPKNPGNLKNSSRSHDVTTTKLEDLGITKNQSSRWQKLAAVPDDQFEQAVSAAKEVAGEVTTAAMLRIEKQNRQEKTNPKPALNRDNDKKLSTGEPLEKPLDDQSSGIDNDAHNEFNQFSEEQIAEEMASEIDVEKELYNAHMEIERLTKIIESDDKLSEIKRLSDLVQHWEEKSNGYQVAVFNKNEDLKKWKRRAEKLERELKNVGMVEF